MKTSEFIEQCISNGIVNFADIADAAKEKIIEIDKFLNEAVERRKHKSMLMQLIKDLQSEDDKNIPDNTSDISNVSDNSFANKIILLFEYEDSISPRNILERLGYSSKDPTPVYQAIKCLTDTGVLVRNDDRTFSPGPEFKEKLKAV